MKSRLTFTALAVLLPAAACGGNTSSTSASPSDQTVKVAMTDIAYSIKTLDVSKGQTVKFEFTNNGKIDHDAFIGDEMAQTEHETEMRGGSHSAKGGMHHGGGSDSSAITVKPGKTGTLSYKFSKAGDILIGCHEPGHYAAGMRIAVAVT